MTQDMRCTVPLFAVLSILLLGCSNQPDIKVPGHIKEIENLTVHPLPTNPDTVVLKYGQQFGNTDEVLIGLKYHVTADDSGRVYLSDLRKNTIHVFQPDGKYLTSLGRKGMGPGEFSSVSSVLHIHSNLLYAYDFPAYRFNLFSLDSLTFHDTIKLDLDSKSGSGQLFPRNHFILRDGNMLIGFMSFGDDSLRYYNVSRKGRIISDELLAQKDAESASSENIAMNLPFGNAPLFAVSAEGNIFTARTTDFLIKEYSPEGEYLRAFYYPYPKSNLDKDEYINGIKNKKFQQFFRQIDFPNKWPALETMFIDDNNRLWVSTISTNQDLYQWWVLNLQGEVIARFQWPRNKAIEEVKNGYLYALETTEATGERQVVRYRVNISSN